MCIEDKSNDYLRMMANKGDLEAKFELGKRIYDGIGFSVNTDEGIRLIREAAESGFAPAQNYIGAILMNGENIAEDKDRGREWISKAAKQGFPKAIGNVAHALQDASLTDSDEHTYVELLKESAEKGYLEAQMRLAKNYYYGNKGFPEDHSLAFEWFMKAAQQGDMTAMTWVGYLYDYGHGVPVSNKDALDWYLKAEDKGDCEAMYRRALHYLNGWGVKPNHGWAVEHMKKAARQGVLPAIRKLGEIYRSNSFEDIERSYPEAAFWYRQGVYRNDTECMIALGKMYEAGEGMLKSPEKAMDLYRKAAEKDDDEAVFMLASRYEEGLTVPKDPEKAMELYRKAADMGNRNAIWRLADWHLFDDPSGTAKDMALMMYRKAAEKGCIGAEMDLGHIYENGVIVTRSVKRALQRYYDVADNGDEEGLANYTRLMSATDPTEKEEEESPLERSMRIAIEDMDGSKCETIADDYFYGRGGLPQSYACAFAWYKEAIEYGNERAATNIGWMYGTGTYLDKDQEQAIRYYTMAAKAGEPVAQKNLAVEYIRGRDENRNVEGFKWARRSAEQGYSTGQYHLGRCYEFGIGTEVDYGKAMEWYRKASDNGDRDSEYHISVLYEYGEGVEADPVKAFAWCMMSALHGSSGAQCRLGMMYKEGIGVDPSLPEAVRWLRKSVDAGNNVAMHDLADIYLGSEEYRNDEEGLALMTRSAEGGYDEAVFRLGTMYLEGCKVEKDVAKAFELFTRAESLGNIAATYNLGLMYLEGNGVEQDKVQGMNLIKLSCNEGYEPAKVFMDALSADTQE